MSNKPTREGLIILSARAFSERRPKEEVAASLISYGCDSEEAARLMAIAVTRVARRRAEQRTKKWAVACLTICIGAALLAAALYASWERTVTLASWGL